MIVPVLEAGDRRYATWARDRAVPSVLEQAITDDITIEVMVRDGESVSAARNAGAADATCEWLLFLDADDELHPDYVQAMSYGTADLRGPATVFVKGRTRQGPLLVPARPLEDSNYLVIGTLIRRAMFLEVGGFNPSWPVHEDYDLWLRCERRAGATIEQLADAIYIVHERADSRNRKVTLSRRHRISREIQAQA